MLRTDATKGLPKLTRAERDKIREIERRVKRERKDEIERAELQKERDNAKIAAPLLERQRVTDTGEVVVETVETVTREEQREARDQAIEKLKGRPSDYTKEEADQICKWIASGKSLNKYCQMHGRDSSSVYRWLREERDFASSYTHAHDNRADTLADEIIEIVDEVQFGTMEEIAAARLRTDARKWIAAKLKPSKWGERIEVENKGSITFNLAALNRTAVGTIPHNPTDTVDVEATQIQAAQPDK